MTPLIRVPYLLVGRSWSHVWALGSLLMEGLAGAYALALSVVLAVRTEAWPVRVVCGLGVPITGVIAGLFIWRLLASLGLAGIAYRIRTRDGWRLGTPRQLLLRRGLFVPDGADIVVEIAPDQPLNEFDYWDVHLFPFGSFIKVTEWRISRGLEMVTFLTEFVPDEEVLADLRTSLEECGLTVSMALGSRLP